MADPPTGKPQHDRPTGRFQSASRTPVRAGSFSSLIGPKILSVKGRREAKSLVDRTTIKKVSTPFSILSRVLLAAREPGSGRLPMGSQAVKPLAINASARDFPGGFVRILNYSAQAALSLTPCFSGVGAESRGAGNRFNGFERFRRGHGSRAGKPLKRFASSPNSPDPPLKQGVNEKGSSRRKNLRCTRRLPQIACREAALFGSLKHTVLLYPAASDDRPDRTWEHVAAHNHNHER